jgi:phosphoserine aminotransferase
MTNFTPGPSQLYFTVPDHIKSALREGVPSLSHRSKEFEKIISNLTEALRELLTIPTTHHIFFTSSATEIWERSIENLVEKHSLHFVNGAFSKRFHEIATQLNRKAVAIEVPEGEGFKKSYTISTEIELIAITHNETSTGVSWNAQEIMAIRNQHKDALIIVDAVSSLPYPTLNFSQIDAAFFSVQKAFGLPAGLGVWIVNERCIAKAKSLQSKGVNIGSYHNLLTLHAYAKKNQTPETPNVLGIYLLSKVVEDFLRRGIQTLRRETEYKAAILYQLLQTHDSIRPFVKDAQYQSKTVIVASTGTRTKEIAKVLMDKGLLPGEGYGKAKDTQLRFANFPAHSKEQYELLVDTLSSING